MSDVIQRFIKRLSLHEYIKYQPSFRIINYVENKTYNTPVDKENTILQLYHVSRNPKNYANIMQKGFYIDPTPKNKGIGVYLSNHGRYSAFWGNPGPTRDVFICNVLYKPEYVKRYRSEIYSPIHNSEYVISNSKLIFPVGLLTYNLTFNSIIKEPIFVEHSKFGCNKCDVKNKYGYTKCCDCKLSGFDTNDIVN
jgi:hypothetical protein